MPEVAAASGNLINKIVEAKNMTYALNNTQIIIKVAPVIDYSVRSLCAKPYYNHKRGCPNYGKKKGCPPEAPLFDKVYDLSKPIYALINVFDLGSHVKRMKELHPEWSQRQLECCLYWQPKARKQLLGHIKSFMKEHKEYQVETCPEAMGVDISKTLENAGIILEWPPKKWVCQVALAGIPLQYTKR
jgi:predicted metal-binding protein